MGESDDEKAAGDDSDDEEQKPAGFDPKLEVENMSEKERKAWNKNLAKYRMFINFLFRHVTIVNYRFNCFEKVNFHFIIYHVCCHANYFHNNSGSVMTSFNTN